MTDSASVVLCTCPDLATARAMAGELVKERLAACVNLLPGVISVYRWEAQVESANEVMMIIKTSRRALAGLEKRISTLHPYDVPEIIALDITAGLPAYLRWIDECVTP